MAPRKEKPVVSEATIEQPVQTGKSEVDILREENRILQDQMKKQMEMML